MKIKEIILELEKHSPIEYQESYDNSGLQIGNINNITNSVLLCLDVNINTVKEAIENKSKLIVSHHPIIFNKLRNIDLNTEIGEIINLCIKNNIAIYSCHTNIDNVWKGVNINLAKKIGLQNIRILDSSKNTLKKLVTYVPINYAEKVRNALFEAGAGDIGNYNSCSYNITGEGTFKAGENTNPFVGKKGILHFEKEVRIETIFPINIQNKIIYTLKKHHPYEEVAFDIYNLENENNIVGIGAIGYIEKPISNENFINLIKTKLSCKAIRHSQKLKTKVSKVAVCGGSGAFLINKAISENADAFVTSDIKYHNFIDAKNKILLIDAGHFETEIHIIKVFYEIINKKFPKFAVHFSKANINPVNYK